MMEIPIKVSSDYLLREPICINYFMRNSFVCFSEKHIHDWLWGKIFPKVNKLEYIYKWNILQPLQMLM